MSGAGELDAPRQISAASLALPRASGDADAMPLLKRSVSLAGHRTSLSLEPEFWAVIDAAIRAEGLSLAGLIAQIDEARGAEPLASSMRVWALDRARRLPER
jgi:predicted DNA-binding ribbon-helix-helix protein